MAGTKKSAKKTAATNIEKYGPDYYSRIGKIGGSAKVKKGFAVRPDVASIAGSISKRGKSA